MKKYHGRKIPKRTQRAIYAAIALNLIVAPNFCAASQSEQVYDDGKLFAELEVFGAEDYENMYTLDSSLIDATKKGFEYWANIINEKNSSPWQIMVVTAKGGGNAMASTYSYNNKNEVFDNYVEDLLQGKRNLTYLNLKEITLNSDNKPVNVPDGEVGLSSVKFEQYLGASRDGVIDGWAIDNETVLPTNEQAADFTATVRHELGHALGIGLNAAKYSDIYGNLIQGETESEIEENFVFNSSGTVSSKFTDTLDSWAAHLVDQNGNKAQPGMVIMTTSDFLALHREDPYVMRSNYFIVDINPNENNPASGFAYFIGDNVSEVLDGTTFYGVNGLPVNAWEGRNNNGDSSKPAVYYLFDGSHLQTSGMMSHRCYSNYTNFMEVELAVMQDLGYEIDRKAFYGRSIYGNGGTIDNTQGYFARNADGSDYLYGTYSEVPLGVGLHIYGSNNNVTQSADILTNGSGAVGVRVDGEGNTLTVPQVTEIHADGYRGKGILVAYGRNQNLNLAGTVTANGSGGNALEFNFGSSSNGASDEYRGSYIRYERNVDDKTGDITYANNLNLTDMNVNVFNSSADELNGAMINNVNITGNISGGENAIYIGKNALVQNINVNEGAEIQGNIKSDWKHFSETDGIFSDKTDASSADETSSESSIKGLKIQYNGGEYDYTSYIPDLVTNLNINTDLNYSGNISGSDNMKINVNSGTFNYSGAANVVGVNVGNGASVFGGTFTLNNMSGNIAEGFSDDTTGTFINHGTIGALSADSTMIINGDLISDGILQGYLGGSKGTIEVSGSANVDGSTLTVRNALPGESGIVLNGGSVSGNWANSNGNPLPISGMLNATGEVQGNSLIVTTQAANNLGTLSDEEQKAYDAMIDMYNELTDPAQKEQMRRLFNLDAASAKKSLGEIDGTHSTSVMSLAQQSTTVDRMISNRISNIFKDMPSLKLNVPVVAAHFADTEGEEKPIATVEVEVPRKHRVENNAWLNYMKNWGSLRGGVDYHGSAIVGGYDWDWGPNWRGGFFVSYGAIGYAADSASARVYDTRFGIYAGYHKKASDLYLYADGGILRNSLHRGIPMLGISSRANYKSRLFEFGGEYKYDLHATDNKIWHVSPFVNFQTSYLHQNGYTESGAGVYNQKVDAGHNTYFVAQLGLDFKRYLRNGRYGFRFGIKHGFAGADPDLSVTYEGSDEHKYRLRNERDKTHAVISLRGECEFSPNWFIGGETEFQRGSHDKDLTASVMFRRIW